MTVTTTSLRDRIVEAAIERTTREGWSSVTMAALAADVGVSRQTVYNEVGAKPALAEAMVLDELARFLAVVRAAFDRRDALEDAVRDAVRGVLELAATSPLLRAVVAGGAAEDADLLPPLTTRSSALLDAARAVLTDCLAPYAVDPARLGAGVDAVVRVVLSHVVSPSGTPHRTADDVAWLATRLLTPASGPGS